MMCLCEEYLSSAGAFTLRVVSYDSPNSDRLLGPLGFELSDRWEFLIDLTTQHEDLWRGLACERRTAIRKAEKLGVETRRENTLEALEQLLRFERESRLRRGQTPTVDERTVAAGRERLASGLVDVFLTYHEGRPVNGALFGYFNGRAYYHMSGTSDAGQRCRGPVHLIWTALNHYHTQGARYVNLGAALPGQEGLYRFKRDFGAQVVPAPIGRKKISAIGSALDRMRSWLGR
jgi:lipid II:glycine glycyltransferase (peptidoglycan interpeptide bridge formation enzyme)